MAVIWQKNIEGIRYQVRKAGKTLRLYTNGVCHSEFNPDRVVTGSIWDLLIIPAYFHSPADIKDVLMLGVGGGASILQLDTLVKPRSITGVEFNSVHLDIARKFFKLNRDPVKLHCDDARIWLENYNDKPFDMIIDDLFIDHKTEPVRAINADTHWFKKLLKHLSPSGIIVTNFGSYDEFKHCAVFTNREVGRRFSSVFKLGSPLLENVVGVFCRKEASSRNLRANLRSVPLLDHALTSKKLRYQIRTITKF